MLHEKKRVLPMKSIVLMLVFLNGLILKFAYLGHNRWYPVLFVTVPLLLIATMHLPKDEL
jgi:hypothetical protein